MSLSTAQMARLHDLARELAAAPAGAGERGRLVARAAGELGRSVKTVYALLRRHTDWTSGRRTRADAGETCVSRDLALAVGGLSHLTDRQNGKRITSITAARERLAANGLGVVDAATGETAMPSAATLSRAMRRYSCHPRQLAAARPASELRSLHPNHVWAVDASVCVLYRLRSGGVRIMDETVYNRHKPARLAELADQRLIRYVVADHFSNAFYLHYEQAPAEDARGVLRALIGAMSDRGPRDPLHGVPRILLMDKGSGNRSSLVTRFLADLGVRALTHAAGNPRAKGFVERLQDIVEKGFESRLRFLETPDLEALQAGADRWRRHFCAHAVLARAGRSRNALWMGIPAAELRTADRAVLEAIAHWGDERRKINNQFRISADTRLPGIGVQEYDLRELGWHGLCPGDMVTVRLNPFRAPAVTVSATLPDGTERSFEVRPVEKDAAGRDVTAPVIGEGFRSAPETAAEKALADIRQRFGPETAGGRPYPTLDIMADVRDAPQYLRRQGRPVTTPGAPLDAPIDARTAAPLPLSHAQAALRLKARCGEAWSADPAACMRLVRARYPDQVPEAALPELERAIRDTYGATYGARLTPRPAAVRPFDGGTDAGSSGTGDRTCATA